jgi:ubiquinone biosynthesis protein COQ4
MTKLQTILELRRALSESGRLGDVAVLKADLFGATRLRPDLQAQLADAVAPAADVDLEALRRLPQGSLGRSYAELLDRNDLEPFRLTDQVPREVIDRQLFVARYGLVHDIFHVLTGFDTSWAGELGVWAFVAGQRYARTHWVAVILACLLYPILAPRQIPRLWRNLRAGLAMGRRARALIVVPFEKLWACEVTVLRRELGIDAPAHELDEVIATPSSGPRCSAPS